MSKNGFLTTDELTPIRGTKVFPGLSLPRVAGVAFNNAVAAGGLLAGMEIREAGAYRDNPIQKAMKVDPVRFGATHGVAAIGVTVHGIPPGAIDVWNWETFGGFRIVRGYRRSGILDDLLRPFGFDVDHDPRYAYEAWHYPHDGVTTGPSRPKERPVLHIVSHPDIPQQPAPVGPYSPEDRKTGGAYELWNDATGRRAQIFGTQDQVDLLGKFMNNAGTFIPTKTPTNTVAQNVAWLDKTLASVGVSGTSAGTTDLKPILDAISKLPTAIVDGVKKIVPTVFKASS